MAKDSGGHVRNDAIRFIMIAQAELNRVIALLASDLDTQVKECHRFGGLDAQVYEGQLRAMEMLRDFGAEKMFDAELWSALWAFTGAVVDAIDTCSGTTDAQVLGLARWAGIRETARLFMQSMPAPFEEERIADFLQADRSETRRFSIT